MKRIMVLANRTLCEQHLLDEVRERKRRSPASFHVVVPATHESGTWSDRQAEKEARARLDDLLDTLAAGGIAATGEIGDARPVYAAQDVLRREPFDEIILSTLPVGISRWLGQNVLRRLRNETGLPVTHVVAERAPAHA